MQGISRQRRRGQGMTEYIIGVGVCGLLLIAAVNLFSFRLDEAIQGSVRALITHLDPPSGTPGDADSNIGADGFMRGWSAVATKDDGTTFTVELKNDGGSWKPWVRSTNSEYTRDAHGSITARAE